MNTTHHLFATLLQPKRQRKQHQAASSELYPLYLEEALSASFKAGRIAILNDYQDSSRVAMAVEAVELETIIAYKSHTQGGEPDNASITMAVESVDVITTIAYKSHTQGGEPDNASIALAVEAVTLETVVAYLSHEQDGRSASVSLAVESIEVS